MKILSNGIAVVDGDTHIAEWVKKHNRLDIARDMLLPFKQYIPKDGVVIDGGANIGDHTVTYAEWVGTGGTVAAYEPLADAFHCLEFNTKHLPQVIPICSGLSIKEEELNVVKSPNVGASYLTTELCEKETPTTYVNTLDFYDYERVDFIKLDVEGYEVRALLGARKTVARCRPVMLIEVNEGALSRDNTSSYELLHLVKQLGYMLNITDPRLNFSSPQYDIICLPM